MTDKDDASVHDTGEPSQAQPEKPSDADFAASELPHETSPFFVISSGEEAAEPAAEVAAEPEDVVTAQAAAEPVAEVAADAAPEAQLSDGLTAELQVLSEELVEPTAEGEAAAEPAEGADADAEPTAESLDDIAPGTVAGAEGETPGTLADAELLDVGPKTKVSWWPFVAYMVVWLGAAGYTVWQLQQLPSGQAAYEADLYGMSLRVGLGLLAAGPALLLIVWLASWIGRKSVRIGSMFLSALIKGATATLFGAIVWAGALLLIDYLRLGRWH